MQDRKEADVGSQVSRISGYLEQGLRTGAEQEVIEDLLVLQRQWGELVRQSEDNMDIGNRQKFFLPSHNPLVASATRSPWARTISATSRRGRVIFSSVSGNVARRRGWRLPAHLAGWGWPAGAWGGGARGWG